MSVPEPSLIRSEPHATPAPRRRAFAACVAALALAGVLNAPARAADLFDGIKARGTLRVALEGTYPPFNFRDPGTGELDGYDVDVAKLVAAKLGLKPEFVTTEWSAILTGLGAGRYDVIVSQVGITPARRQAYDFSMPYTYSTPQVIVRRNDTAVYRRLDDLRGKKVGVGQGSVFEQQLRTVPGVIVRSYPAAPENLQDLAFGRIDAALNDSLMVSYLLRHSQLPIRAGARVGEVMRMGIVFQKNNPRLHAAVDGALEQARADGGLARAAVKWFGSDASRAP